MKDTILLITLCMLTAIPAFAQIPQTMSYQGVLSDEAGNAVADGSYVLNFALYETAEGGTAIWQETQEVAAGNGLGGITNAHAEVHVALEARPRLVVTRALRMSFSAAGRHAIDEHVDQVREAGVQMYEYGDGFLHQKVVLIDDVTSSIGTANFDNRSFRLNFEISVLTFDEDFAQQVERMLIRDFEKSTVIDSEALAARSRLTKLGSRVARLFSPVL